MKLNLTFATPEDAQAFSAKTGENDLNNVHIGLINIALKSPGLVSCTAVGEPAQFLVLRDGVWVTETIADPVPRIIAGEIIEPADGKIKMLAGETWSYDSGTWGQIRISNRYAPIIWPVPYGELTPQRRVEVIVVDSGINAAHSEFEGVTVENLYKSSVFADYSDDIHHGTAIASLIAGKTLGVLPAAVIKVVKITSASHKPSLIELGLAFDAIMSHHAANPSVPKVVNLSWGIPKSLYIESKLQQLVDAGIVVVAAAGNTAMNIDDITPAGFAQSLTVAASTKDDSELVGVYGVTKKISLYAPGQDISVAAHTSPTGFATYSGSSLSAAFASGVAAQYFALGESVMQASQILENLSLDSTPLALSVGENVSLDENKLLHRVDSGTTIYTKSQYIGSFTIAALTETPQELAVARFLPLPFINTQPVYTINFADADSAALLSGTEVNYTLNSLKIAPVAGAALPEGVRIKLVSFTITATLPGLTFTSTPIFFYLTTPDVDSDTELDSYLAEMGDYNNIDFRLYTKGSLIPI